ncbi:hypothetical protein LV457_10830 [Mycobacterium sp. MYCO198283]|uniref:hypothetical protein n=1 Tax=Mycobacterium sp. MYCO198283 TaxID=2883505 RepID=UPI001E37C4D3|nr:hypothetical protein [Mycobacterium sp. MYCO198283]MCG5432781.1 hypothetical protein [Mycobacterium sp. MYCO198283]
MAQPPFGWPSSSAPSKTRPSWLPVALSTLGVVLAAAALLVALLREPAAPQAFDTPKITAAPQATLDDKADRALCEEIAPLMTEGDSRTRQFNSLIRGSAEQQAALPEFRSYIQGWASEMQNVLNSNSQPPRFLTRTVQSFIDVMLLWVGRDNASDDVAMSTYRVTSSYYSGPQFRCEVLGVPWQR